MLKKDRLILSKFIGLFLKKGKKLKTQKLLNKVFTKVATSNNISKHVLLLKVFSRLNTFVEIREIGSYKGKNLVPFLQTENRRMYYMIKFLLSSINEDSRRISFVDKLSLELNGILNGLNTRSMQKRQKVLSDVSSNRSNAHYRW